MIAERNLRFWLIGLALFLLALYLLRPVLLPFVAGMAIAYFLDPLCDRLQRWGCSRTVATLIVVFGFILAAVAVVLLLVPMLHAQITDLLARVPRYAEMLRERILPLLRELQDQLALQDEPGLGQAIGARAGDLVGWVANALSTLLSGGLALANILSLIFITPIVAFYLLRDWDRLVEKIDSWLPRRQAEVIRQQAREIDRTLAGYVRGQSLVCLFLGAYYAIGLSLVGLDFGLSIGVITGILSFIPFVGSVIGFVASMAVAFAQFAEWWSIALVAAVFFSGQFIEGNFLSPKLVGDRVGLHPVWVIFALLAGGALFGFLGVLLALPVAAMIGVLARFALGRYLQSPYYGGAPAPPAAPPAGGDRPAP